MPSSKYLNNLTPMRGIAALLTVLFHVEIFLGFDVLVKVEKSLVVLHLPLMVDFFFILSGFIMFHVYGKLFAESVTLSSFKKFAVARFARVYPLHLLMLCYCILLFFVAARAGVAKDDGIEINNSVFSAITNLLLLQAMNIHNWFSFNHAAWSISTEWWAYMLFPFLVMPVLKMNTAKKIAVALACMGGYLAITYYLVGKVTVPPEIPFVKIDPAWHTINVAYQFGYVRCLSGFIWGMMLYQAYTQQWGKKIFGNGYMLLLLTAVAFTSMHFALPDFISVSFFPFILLCGAYGSKGIDRLFSSKPLQRLGDWSFSIYMIHQPLLFTIGKVIKYFQPVQDPSKKPGSLEGWIFFLVFLMVVLFISYLTYRFVEVPARRMINEKNTPSLQVAPSRVSE